jgi:AICAR transformylase/IMP cyclohydrolase PurH
MMIYTVVLPLMLLALSLTGCAHRSDPFYEPSSKSIALMQQAKNRSLSQETRIQVAHELFKHRSSYDRIIQDPSAERSNRSRARNLKQADGETAGAALHTIAEEYVANGEAHKARAIYYSVLSLFPEDEYRSIREAAQTELKRLDDKEQRTKDLQ